MTRPRVFFDADVLFAGSVSITGASHILLRLSELTLLDGITSEQAVTEAARNLSRKLPQYASTLRALVASAVEIIPDPSFDALRPYLPEADLKDVPILAAACIQGADYLVTFNSRDYWPRQDRHIEVSSAGDLLLKIREQVAHLP